MGVSSAPSPTPAHKTVSPWFHSAFLCLFSVKCTACSTRCKDKSDSSQYLYTISVRVSICVKHAKEAAICYKYSNYCGAVSAINPCLVRSTTNHAVSLSGASAKLCVPSAEKSGCS